MRRAALAAAATASVVVAGCGGGGGKSATGTRQSTQTSTARGPALSRAEFIAQGDRLCQSYRAQVRAIPNPSASPSVSETLTYLRALAIATSRLLTQFRALTPPTGDEAVVNNYLNAMGGQIQLTTRAADALTNGNATAAQADLQALQQAGPRVRALAQGYGFKVCGSPQS
jgi:hypothetical protein